MHAFLSYSHDDHDRAAAVRLELAHSQLQVWWDPAIRVGSRWQAEIDGILQNARCVVVLWSRTAAASRHVLYEAVAGLERGALVPAFLERCDVPEPFDAIEGAQLADWRPGVYHPEFLNLVNAVRTFGMHPSQWRGAFVGAHKLDHNFRLELAERALIVTVRVIVKQVAVAIDGRPVSMGSGSSNWDGIPIADGGMARQGAIHVDVRALGGLKRVRISIDGVELVDHRPG